ELGLGDGTTTFVRVTGANGQIVLTSAGMYAYLEATVTADIPDVSVTGAFKLALNNTGAAQQVNGGTVTIDPGLKVTGTGLAIDILGQHLGGNFTFEQVDGPNNTKVIKVSVDHLTLKLANPSSPSAPFVEITDGTGALIIDRHGVAATLSVTAQVNLPSPLSL